MIEVITVYVTEEPEYQKLTQNVILEEYDQLTPKAARDAMEKAFGLAHGGMVWTLDRSYGYRVYPNSTRKIYQDD